MQTREVIKACAQAFKQVRTMDCNNYEAKKALEDALHIIETYPGISTFQRGIYKARSIQNYIYRIRTTLKGILLNGQASEETLTQIKEDLDAVLSIIDKELKSGF